MRLRAALAGILSSEELALLVTSFDVVGDIAIIIIPPELAAREREIGGAVLAMNKKIQVVARRRGNYQGENRTIGLDIIAGENRLVTVHREHGVRLRLDPSEVYFSVRSGGERRRLAGLVREGEDILVMFSGIGACPLVIARHSPAATITGIEKNPRAHGFARQNLALNRKIKNVRFLEGDVARMVPLLNRAFDRVVMPLPKGGEQFLGLALEALVPGGHLHFYAFQARGDTAGAVARVEAACVAAGRTLLKSRVVVCGHTAPRTYRVCVDAEVG